MGHTNKVWSSKIEDDNDVSFYSEDLTKIVEIHTLVHNNKEHEIANATPQIAKEETAFVVQQQRNNTNCDYNAIPNENRREFRTTDAVRPTQIDMYDVAPFNEGDLSKIAENDITTLIHKKHAVKVDSVVEKKFGNAFIVARLHTHSEYEKKYKVP